jgi:hypothetical protein
VLSHWIKSGGLLALVAIGGAGVLVSSHWPFTRDIVLWAGCCALTNLTRQGLRP